LLGHNVPTIGGWTILISQNENLQNKIPKEGYVNIIILISSYQILLQVND
jgi:hypothetical protein